MRSTALHCVVSERSKQTIDSVLGRVLLNTCFIINNFNVCEIKHKYLQIATKPHIRRSKISYCQIVQQVLHPISYKWRMYSIFQENIQDTPYLQQELIRAWLLQLSLNGQTAYLFTSMLNSSQNPFTRIYSEGACKAQCGLQQEISKLSHTPVFPVVKNSQRGPPSEFCATWSAS